MACPGFIDIFTYLVSLKKVIRIKKKLFPSLYKGHVLLFILILPFLVIVFPQMATGPGLSIHIYE